MLVEFVDEHGSYVINLDNVVDIRPWHINRAKITEFKYNNSDSTLISISYGIIKEQLSSFGVIKMSIKNTNLN
jgi:hypothetical protein